MRAAGEIALFEPDVGEHRLGERDVLRLAAVRRARERELVVAPPQLVEAARLEKRHHLERLGAGAPGADDACVARAGDERIIFGDDRRVHGWCDSISEPRVATTSSSSVLMIVCVSAQGGGYNARPVLPPLPVT